MKHKKELLVLGMVVTDHKEIYKNGKQSKHISLGGPPSFMGFVGKVLSNLFEIIDFPTIYTYSSPKQDRLIKKFTSPEENSWVIKERLNSPNFYLKYYSPDKERSITLKNAPQTFKIDDFEWNSFKNLYIVVGSVFHEFDDINIFKFLRKRADFIAFDLQGCLREFKENSQELVVYNWWKPELINEIDCLKVSKYELENLSIFTTTEESIIRILKEGLKFLIVTLGSEGSLLGVKKIDEKISIYSIPSYHTENVIDETGAGDVFLYSFVVWYKSIQDPLHAVAYATSIASLLIEDLGIQGNFNKQEIEYRKKFVYSRIKRIK